MPSAVASVQTNDDWADEFLSGAQSVPERLRARTPSFETDIGVCSVVYSTVPDCCSSLDCTALALAHRSHSISGHLFVFLLECNVHCIVSAEVVEPPARERAPSPSQARTHPTVSDTLQVLRA